MTIQDRLKLIIKDSGLSTKDFCEKTKIPYKTMQNYVSGTRKIGIDTLIKISLHMEGNIDWLLTGKGKMYQDETKEDVSLLLEEESKLETITEWLKYFWHNSDQKHKMWLEIQMQNQFPDYNRWLNNQNKSSLG